MRHKKLTEILHRAWKNLSNVVGITTSTMEANLPQNPMCPDDVVALMSFKREPEQTYYHVSTHLPNEDCVAYRIKTHYGILYVIPPEAEKEFVKRSGGHIPRLPVNNNFQGNEK